MGLYCAYLIQVKNRQSSTVKSYVSGIKSILQNDGYEWDNNLLVLNSLIGTHKLDNDCLKTRLPIRQRLLENFLFHLQRYFAAKNQPYLEILYVVAFLLAYYGMMRVGELTDSHHVIKAKNVHRSEDRKHLLIVLYSSKTHGPGQRPQKIKIKGKTHLCVTDKGITYTNEDPAINKKIIHFCPMKWTNRYIQVRGPYLEDNEQFLIFSDGTPLKPMDMRKILRRIMSSLNLQANLYDIHSFRIGRATDLYKNNISIEKIKELGRWKSNAVYKYLRF